MGIDRREFLAKTGKYILLTSAAALAWDFVKAGRPEAAPDYTLRNHWWAFAIDIEKCIGCGNCVRACKTENDVPLEPYYFRTWVERYHVPNGNIEHPEVDSPNGGYDGFPPRSPPGTAPRISSCPNSATTARILPAPRCVPWAPPSTAPMGWSWWTRPTVWAAGTACRHARMAVDSSTRER